MTTRAGSRTLATKKPFSSPARPPSSSAAAAATQMFTPLLNSQPIKLAHMARFEATARSMLPVMIMNTIGSIISPISIKSEAVRNRLLTLKKKGDRMELTIVTTTISRISIHSQRINVATNDCRGG